MKRFRIVDRRLGGIHLTQDGAWLRRSRLQAQWIDHHVYWYRRWPFWVVRLERHEYELMSRHCSHLWQPYADTRRIWQVCAKCGKEKHVTTHAAALADRLRYIMGKP